MYFRYKDSFFRLIEQLSEEEKRVVFVLFNMVVRTGKFPDGYGFTLTQNDRLSYGSIAIAMERLIKSRMYTGEASVAVWISDYKLEEQHLRAKFHLGYMAAKRLTDVADTRMDLVQQETLAKLKKTVAFRMYVYLCMDFPTEYKGRVKLETIDRNIDMRTNGYIKHIDRALLLQAEHEIDMWAEFNIRLNMLYSGAKPVGVEIIKTPKVK